MKARKLPLMLVAGILLIAGCASSNQASEEEAGAEGDVIQTEQFVMQRARVFLDGVDKGVTPQAVRVDRRFGYSELLLRIGKERVRLYEFDLTKTSNFTTTQFSFSYRGDGQYVRLNVEDLPEKRNSEGRHRYVPYTQEPLWIVDNDYGLEIIVR